MATVKVTAKPGLALAAKAEVKAVKNAARGNVPPTAPMPAGPGDKSRADGKAFLAAVALAGRRLKAERLTLGKLADDFLRDKSLRAATGYKTLAALATHGVAELDGERVKLASVVSYACLKDLRAEFRAVTRVNVARVKAGLPELAAKELDRMPGIARALGSGGKRMPLAWKESFQAGAKAVTAALAVTEPDWKAAREAAGAFREFKATHRENGTARPVKPAPEPTEKALPAEPEGLTARLADILAAIEDAAGKTGCGKHMELAVELCATFARAHSPGVTVTRATVAKPVKPVKAA